MSAHQFVGRWVYGREGAQDLFYTVQETPEGLMYQEEAMSGILQVTGNQAGGQLREGGQVIGFIRCRYKPESDELISNFKGNEVSGDAPKWGDDLVGKRGTPTGAAAPMFGEANAPPIFGGSAAAAQASAPPQAAYASAPMATATASPVLIVQGVAVPLAVLQGFIAALQAEYLTGSPNAVGTFFGREGLKPDVVGVLEPEEDAVRSALNKQQKILSLSQRWGLVVAPPQLPQMAQPRMVQPQMAQPQMAQPQMARPVYAAQPLMTAQMGAPQQVFMVNNLRNESTFVTCPNCRGQIKTAVRHEMGTGSWAVTCGIFWCSAAICCPCSVLPCCIPACQDAYHECPHCRTYLGVHKFLF